MDFQIAFSSCMRLKPNLMLVNERHNIREKVTLPWFCLKGMSSLGLLNGSCKIKRILVIKYNKIISIVNIIIIVYFTFKIPSNAYFCVNKLNWFYITHILLIMPDLSFLFFFSLNISTADSYLKITQISPATTNTMYSSLSYM